LKINLFSEFCKNLLAGIKGTTKGKSKMTDGEQMTEKEKLIAFIHNLTNDEAEKIIAFLQDTEREHP
jgi:hypothetical protein